MKVSKYDLRIILLWFAIFQFYIPNEKIYYVYQAVVAGFIFLDSFEQIIKRSKYLLMFMYPLTIIISCIINRDTILYTQVFRGCIGALLIMDIFLVIKQYEKKRGVDKLFEILYNMSKLYVVFSILWVIVLGMMGSLQKAVLEEFLFMRGKFPTAYMLIFYLMLFGLTWNGNHIFSKKWKKTLFVLQVIACIGICTLIETSTGIMAIFIFLILTLFGKNLMRFIDNPFVIVGMIILSMFFVLGLSAILRFSFVQNIIVNILHEDLSLTGRMELYTLLFPLILKAGLWGGGFGSYVAATLAYHGWYNAQNGLAEIILTYGFAGGIAFLLLVFTSVACAKNSNIMFYLVIFVFIVVAVVEIPFNSGFILLLSLLQVQYDNRVDFIEGP